MYSHITNNRNPTRNRNRYCNRIPSISIHIRLNLNRRPRRNNSNRNSNMSTHPICFTNPRCLRCLPRDSPKGRLNMLGNPPCLLRAAVIHQPSLRVPLPRRPTMPLLARTRQTKAIERLPNLYRSRPRSQRRRRRRSLSSLDRSLQLPQHHHRRAFPKC